MRVQTAGSRRTHRTGVACRTATSQAALSSTTPTAGPARTEGESMPTPSRQLHRRTLPICLAATLVGGAVVLVPSVAAAGGGGDGDGGGGGGGHGHGARSVIFVNGDGMSAAQREAGRLDQVGFDGELVMNTLGVTGLQTTDPRDPEDTVTDSAAGASAWATGVKTYNGAVSVDVDGNPLPTIGAEAHQ